MNISTFNLNKTVSLLTFWKHQSSRKNSFYLIALTICIYSSQTLSEDSHRPIKRYPADGKLVLEGYHCYKHLPTETRMNCLTACMSEMRVSKNSATGKDITTYISEAPGKNLPAGCYCDSQANFSSEQPAFPDKEWGPMGRWLSSESVCDE